MWGATKNLAHAEKGKFRSIAGYAGESLAIGRALLCGYNLFFKAWRDAKYDAVLDFDGVLFRIEIKQTQTDNQLSVTSGGRSGKQINREVKSREEVLSSRDCDFLIGVKSLTGECWIVPIEFVEILGRKNLRLDFTEPFEECWQLFRFHDLDLAITPDDIRIGFRDRSLSDLKLLCQKLEISVPKRRVVQVSPRTKVELNGTDYRIIRIWEALARRAKTR